MYLDYLSKNTVSKENVEHENIVTCLRCTGLRCSYIPTFSRWFGISTIYGLIKTVSNLKEGVTVV